MNTHVSLQLTQVLPRLCKAFQPIAARCILRRLFHILRYPLIYLNKRDELGWFEFWTLALCWSDFIPKRRIP